MLWRLCGTIKGPTGIVSPQLKYRCLPLSFGRKLASIFKFPSTVELISCWVQIIHGILHSRSEDALDLTGASRMHPSFSSYKDSISSLDSHKALSPKRLPRCPSRRRVIEIFVVYLMTKRGKRQWSHDLFDCLGDVDTCALWILVLIIHIHVLD